MVYEYVPSLLNWLFDDYAKRFLRYKLCSTLYFDRISVDIQYGIKQFTVYGVDSLVVVDRKYILIHSIDVTCGEVKEEVHLFLEELLLLTHSLGYYLCIGYLDVSVPNYSWIEESSVDVHKFLTDKEISMECNKIHEKYGIRRY